MINEKNKYLPLIFSINLESSFLLLAIIKTPIVSTDVGIASEVLSKESIFSDESNFSQASPNIEISYENAKKFTIPQGMRLYIEMFEKLHES